MSTPVKILSLNIENVKRLYAVDITPSQPVVAVCGNNEQGKSSVLDSIQMALGGKDSIPPQPIHTGKDSAEIVIKLDNGIVVTRTFTATGTYLKVVNEKGVPYSSPQALLDELTGKLTFDPLAFLKLDSTKQADTLRKLLGIDLAPLKAKHKKIYEERTAVNRRLEELRAQVGGLPSFPDAPKEEVSSIALLAEIDTATAHNNGIEAQRSKAAAVLMQIKSVDRDLASVAAQIVEAERKLGELRERQNNLTADKTKLGEQHSALMLEEAKLSPIDLAPLSAQLSTFEETNRKVRANSTRAKVIEEGKRKKGESDALTKQLEALEAEQVKTLTEAKFPVEGLSFAEDAVLYNGLPLEQASGAGRLRVSVAIGAALNPQLRVILIRDGSLLDDKNLEALRKTAEELNLQVWLEKVGEGKECSVVIEDGRVRGAVQPVAPPPEPPKKARKKKVEVTTQDDPFA